jgi:hypothetical protein
LRVQRDAWSDALSPCQIRKLMETGMNLARTLLACLVCSVTLAGAARAQAPQGCKEPEIGTKQVPAFSPPIANVVIGTGRLQFHSAPNARCPMDGVFVIPKDELIAYAETSNGWSSVMYVNPRSGNNVSGWVKSTRLKQTGAVGPKQ